MKTGRRNFIRQAIGAGLITTGSLSGLKAESLIEIYENTVQNKTHRQHFNMCGYRAPKLNTVKIGCIGVGNRGYANLKQLTYLDGVEIKAICDLMQFRIDEAQTMLKEQGFPLAKVYVGSSDLWKKMCEDPDIDLITIAVPRGPLHAEISIYAMECGKHVAVEVPAVSTISEAWRLVETSEKTKRHCALLENCCYDFFELLTLNMVRQGFFGDLIHADAAYIHHQNNYDKTRDGDMWRLKESQHHNGNLYPTHGLGPVCQAMDINRGDRLTKMVSMSSDDFMMGETVAELARTNNFYEEFNTHSYRGNMNTSILRTEKGKTIMLQYDITSPRVYSRIHMLSGTKAAALKYPLPSRISVGHEWLNDEEMSDISEKYMPEICRRIGNMAKQVGGHGGMDFLMTWRLIDCLRNGLPMDMDVYDAALWGSIIPLSEWSVANGSFPIEIPDFTCGTYKVNTPIDISLSEGANTKIRTVHL
ncbi:MAG: Gfo/Idh/MocA family oxidoreductase [Massilibacteroides sp.]|nr:Gfo/Idh/MocA family oxidoreductase [Massilibacteroides sp.]MDD3061297.1 Gfo/Idh/MocA family oxidoreductase [Massilibacteroides sp.]MDD4116221.1 Gfo/Idh/MocA family oxidoreductase [Massilibacteroides sp.]MDD4659794.1 Gfo/Idh/MocA family oxidoreductase [Massilibacteroides sp.]